MAAGSGKAAHVGDRLERIRSQQRDELSDGTGGVTDGPDGRHDHPASEERNPIAARLMIAVVTQVTNTSHTAP